MNEWSSHVPDLVPTVLVANPARGQLNSFFFLLLCSPTSPFTPGNSFSRKTGSAVPPRVSLLIPHPQAESGAHRAPLLLSATMTMKASIHNANRGRVSPAFMGSINYVPMAVRQESPRPRLRLRNSFSRNRFGRPAPRQPTHSPHPC